MSLSVCVLASGSSGNSILVSSETTSILIDAGLSCRQLQARLEEVGVRLAALSGLCITHEHGDHTSGAARIHRLTGMPVYANSGTIEALERSGPSGVAWTVFTTGQTFQIGDLTVAPFSVPHDSYDPVGFVITATGGARVGITTDIGMATSLVRERLRDCAVLVIESNHDEQMLRDAPRPWHLKQRIAGRQGHLSNRQAGELLAELAGPSTHAVFLSHLSSDCNTPEVAMRTVSAILAEHGLARVVVHMTYQDRISARVVV